LETLKLKTNIFLKISIYFFVCYAILIFFYKGIFQARAGRKPDFDPYYVAAKCLELKQNPYNIQTLLETSIKLNAQKRMNEINKCVYPPFYMQLLKPFLLFDINTARIIWSILANLLFLIVIFLVLYNTLARKQIENTIIFFAIILFMRPLYITIALGQVNLFILCLLFLCFYNFQKNNSFWFAVSLAAAILIKIFPVIILLFLLLVNKKKMLFYSITVLFLLVVISAYFNFVEYKIYFFEVLPQFAQGAANQYNISFWNLLEKFNYVHAQIYTLIFQSIIVLFFILISVLSLYKNKLKNKNAILENLFALAILAVLLIQRTLWEHHLLVCVLPILIFLNSLTIETSTENKTNFLYFAIVIVMFAIISIDIDFSDTRLNNYPLFILQHTKFFALLIVYFVIINYVYRRAFLD